MTTPIDAANYIEVLRQAIPDSHRRKEQILNYALKQLVLLSKMQACDEMDDPVVQRAVNLYLRATPEAGGIPPSLPVLIRWLRGRRGLDYTAKLEKRLAQIRKQLSILKVSHPMEMVEVHPGLIISLRFLAGLEDIQEE